MIYIRLDSKCNLYHMSESDTTDEITPTESLQGAKEQVQKKHQIIESLILDEKDNLVDRGTFEERLEEYGLTMFEGNVYVNDSDCLAYTVGREALNMLRKDIHPSVGLRDVEEEAEELHRLGIDVYSIKQEKRDKSSLFD